MAKLKAFGALLAAGLWLSGCAAAENDPAPAEPSLYRAKLLIWEDEPDQAAQMASAILAELPPPQTYDEVTRYADTLLVLCEAQTALERYAAAEESCLKAIDTFEADRGGYQRQAPLDAYDQLFAVYERAGNAPDWIVAEMKARQRYLKRLPVQAMLIVPRIDALTRIGDLHRSTGDWQASETAYREAIAFTDQLPHYHYSDADLKPCRHLSRLYRERGDSAATEAALRLCEEK